MNLQFVISSQIYFCAMFFRRIEPQNQLNIDNIRIFQNIILKLKLKLFHKKGEIVGSYSAE